MRLNTIRKGILASVWLASLILAAGRSDARPVWRAHVGEPSGGLAATLDADRQLYLEAMPRPGEGLIALGRRFSAQPGAPDRISAANGGTRTLLAGSRYKIPFSTLRPDWQLRVVQSLFARDYPAASGWFHEIGNASNYGPVSLWHVAEWFTGRGDNYRAIRRENQVGEDDLKPGQSVLIPARLLRPALRAALPRDSPYYLEYGTDRAGQFASYRLKPGEALYSSVVIRFTGRVYGEDVADAARQIAERNEIERFNAIPAGAKIKIPFELLEPEFLPATDVRRREYEAGLEASSRFSNRVQAKQLAGVTVILDPGHGGSDVGASHGDLWESVYVYDVMVRVKQLLESETGAAVYATTRDGSEHRVIESDVLNRSRRHTVLTNPRYLIEDSTVGLHLRWYLANSLMRRVATEPSERGKVVFLSIHADSLHPSIRGGMAYIPGARYRTKAYGREGLVYSSRREVRESPEVRFLGEELIESEGLSREFAGRLMAAFEDNGLPVHPDKPIREKIIRNRSEWVPAVLRYNAIPAKALVEICNLSNEEDRELIQTQEFRQRVARALVDGIIAYYGDDRLPEPVRLAHTAR